MPRDYKNTIIYKIICNDLSITDMYIGSTTNFVNRLGKHKTSCNNENDTSYNYKVYKIIREKGGFSNWTMYEVEKYPCETRKEAFIRERYWTDILKCNMNSQRAMVTEQEVKDEIKINNKKYKETHIEENKEYSKQYYIDNKAKKDEYHAQYVINNRDKINKKRRESRIIKNLHILNNNAILNT